MDEKVIRENIERDTRDVELEETSCFVAAISNKAFVTPSVVLQIRGDIRTE